MLRYLLIALIALAAVGCSGLPGQGPPPPTPLPFNLHTAQQVLDAFRAAGLSVINPTREMQVGRGAPTSFRDRYVFAIEGVAPNGGQVLIFDTPEALAQWTAYIERLRANSATRRDVSYVYTFRNVMIQINADLPLRTAQAYRDALEGLSP